MAVNFDLASAMQYGDGQGLKIFFLEHRFAHDAIAQAIAATANVSTSNFDVADSGARAEWELLMLHAEGGPQKPRAVLSAWLELHERLHQQEYDLLRMGELPDLATVNFYVPDAFADWMFSHQQIHAAVSSSLGIA